MLEAVRIIGSILNDKSSLTLEDYLSKAKLKNTTYVLSIVITNGSYKSISVDEYRDDYIDKYLYASGSSNGPDKTPASLITEPSKTFTKKILSWFKKYANDRELCIIKEVLENNTNDIIQDITLEYNRLGKPRNTLLTIKTADDEFIGEKENVRKILINLSKKRESIIGMCMFCHNEKPLIKDKDKSPISEIFSFSTFDKKGFLNNFNELNIQKQIPICSECYNELKIGKEWIGENTYFKDISCYLLLDTNIENRDEIHEFIDIVKHFKEQNKKLQYNNLMQEEEDLTELLSHKIFNLLFVFVSSKGGGKYIDIRKYIEDVPTTWIKTIYDKFNETLQLYTFSEENMHNIFGKKWQGDFSKQKGIYLMGLIKTFFPPDSIYIPFLDAVEILLKGFQFDQKYLLSAFLQKIRSEIYKNYNDSKKLALKSLVLFVTLYNLNLINGQKKSIDMQDEQSRYMDDQLKFLNTNAKKAVYLEGMLVNKVISIQYQRLKNTPFIDKLHGLHLSFVDAKKLLPQIINKLREYEITYKELEEETARYFLLAEKDSLSTDETSYYFTLGMLIGNEKPK